MNSEHRVTYRCTECDKHVEAKSIIMWDDPMNLDMDPHLTEMRDTMHKYWKEKGKEENIEKRVMKPYHKTQRKHKPLGMCHGYVMKDTLCGPLREETDSEYYIHWLGYDKSKRKQR
jgi:hypothetical protein